MRLLIALTLVMFIASPLIASDELDKKSVYQVDSVWRDQNGKPTQLSELRGKIQLVAFVYTFCEHTCPIIVFQIESILAAIDENVKDVVHVTLVTLAPKQDTPDKLKEYMARRGLNESKWTMLNGDPANVRVLANLFDVKYRPMRKDQLAHSNLVTLLDQQGVIRYQLRGVGAGTEQLIEQMNKLAH